MRYAVVIASVAVLSVAIASAQDAVVRPPTADEDAECTQPNGPNTAIECCVVRDLSPDSCTPFDPVTLVERSGRVERPPSADVTNTVCEFEGPDEIECCPPRNPMAPVTPLAGVIIIAEEEIGQIAFCQKIDANTLQLVED